MPAPDIDMAGLTEGGIDEIGAILPRVDWALFLAASSPT